MFKDIAVEEAKRSVFFKDGAKATFNNVKWFNASGSYLRLGSDEGYVILNSSNINYMVVPEEARVA
jgi:hypothetical protein